MEFERLATIGMAAVTLAAFMFLNSVSKQLIMSAPTVLYHSPERSNIGNNSDTFTTRFTAFVM
jgi:hypothetical protein